jgi:hypothetical protein
MNYASTEELDASDGKPQLRHRTNAPNSYAQLRRSIVRFITYDEIELEIFADRLGPAGAAIG